jgi:hypothetical protein
MNKKNYGIHTVLQKHNRLVNYHINEDARKAVTSIQEADDDLNLDEKDPTIGDETDPNLNTQQFDTPGEETPQDTTDTGADDDIDLDALGDLGDDQQLPDQGLEQPGTEPQPTDAIAPVPGAETEPIPSLGSTEPTEEIDVTQFVEKGEELTNKVDTQVQALTQQIDGLTKKLQSMDTMIGKIQQVEDEIQAMKPPKPIETLRLRSLDSYPYSQGIDDYWKKKEMEINKLRDFNRVDNQEYVLTNDDVDNFSPIQVRDSLNPKAEEQSSFDRFQSDERGMGSNRNLS